MSSVGIYYFSKGNRSCGALDIATKIFFAVWCLWHIGEFCLAVTCAEGGRSGLSMAWACTLAVPTSSLDSSGSPGWLLTPPPPPVLSWPLDLISEAPPPPLVQIWSLTPFFYVVFLTIKDWCKSVFYISAIKVCVSGYVLGYLWAARHT